MTTTDRNLESIGKSQYESICEMVAALECDYDRLAELTAMDADEMTDYDRAELTEIREQAGDCTNREDAEQRIQEDALSVEVRSGWTTVGEEMEASEFCILLCAGGPAARIRGELDQDFEPSRAWLEVRQFWGRPWTRYFDADQDVLLNYARQFYYGA